MEAQNLQFTQFLQGAKQFIIPIFQRTYSWKQSHCEQLWQDILRVGNDPDIKSHFIGSVVYIPDQETSAAIPLWRVIDGQQRITTIMLLLLNFMQRLEKENLTTPMEPEAIKDYYLQNRHGKGEQKYKILLTRTDKDTLIALLEGQDLPEPISQQIKNNFQFFKDSIATADLNKVHKGIQKLMIIDVRLQQGLDDPQMIFESMNSTGKALTQADLIRNFILMGLSHEQQVEFYKKYWEPMEINFGTENYSKKFDEFMRYFLVIQTKNHRIKQDAVYQEFKNYSQNRPLEELLASLKEFSEYYCCIALGKEKDTALKIVFKDIRELRSDVCYPLLMEVYRDYSLNSISKGEFVEVVLLVESYVFRRVVCGIPTNSLRQTFATLTQKLNKASYLESIKAAFLILSSYRSFPSDKEFKQAFKERDLYNFKRRSYWLRRFENHNRKERVQVENYTIEHIMPQNKKLRKEWQQALGEKWEEIQEKYLHTLGNLTLTGYNSEYSDRPFNEKRDMQGGFRESPLKLNQGLAKYENWNETTIQERAEKLATLVIAIWKAPSLPENILEIHRTKEKIDPEYSIEDHSKLSSGFIRELFDAFRKEVLALDENIQEEFLKSYVAYKAETNFVHVIARTKRLLLYLNIDFPEIDDSRGLCRDVTNVGSLGGGNVEISLEKLEDIPYVLGLVRQALEQQLGEEVEE